jgi:hypothetical protein
MAPFFCWTLPLLLKLQLIFARYFLVNVGGDWMHCTAGLVAATKASPLRSDL